MLSLILKVSLGNIKALFHRQFPFSHFIYYQHIEW